MVKIHCSVLAESAVKSAIENYKQKQNTVAEETAATKSA